MDRAIATPLNTLPNTAGGMIWKYIVEIEPELKEPTEALMRNAKTFHPKMRIGEAGAAEIMHALGRFVNHYCPHCKRVR